MSNFNFALKVQSYEIVLKKIKEFLLIDDLENGKYYLQKAIGLSEELIVNSSIKEMKDKYLIENKKLKNIYQQVCNNNNPFIKQTTSINTQPMKSKNENIPFFKTLPPHTTLADVAGLDKVKEEINLNVIIPVKHFDLYSKYKDKNGCQILMYGPPGCGKTFVAEAIAGELQCAYAVINAYDILDKYVGEAPKKIKQIFDEASRFERCLIFFDELDALFTSRESDDSRYTKEVLTTFLTYLSGFNGTNNKSVKIIIGATNRPWALDSALLRGKRFDTQIYVGLPDEEARRFIINKIYKTRQNIINNTNVDINYLIEKLKGYSCADIETIIDRINTKSLSRAVHNREYGTTLNEKVTREDVDDVLNEFRNSVSIEMIKAYEAFKEGRI